MNFAKKEQLVKEGYLSKSTFLNLVLFNYTDHCTYKKYWIPETLESRGTIYDMNTGAVVARAFDKFFNLGEHTSTVESLPSCPFEVEEKMDGSLGILFQLPGKTHWLCATRGSFYSDQAQKAKIILEKYDMSKWPSGWTPLVEIIYPENRIILDYGDEEKLVLLAARNIEDGRYMDSGSLDQYAKACGFPRPKREKRTVEELVAHAAYLPATHEGWVLVYANGFRVKVKGTRYLELARFKANLNPLTIWEVMMFGNIEEFLEKCPEEFQFDATHCVATLTGQHRDLYHRAGRALAELDLVYAADEAQAKEMALKIQTKPDWMQSYLFSVIRDPNGVGDPKRLFRLLRPKSLKFVEIKNFPEA